MFGSVAPLWSRVASEDSSRMFVVLLSEGATFSLMSTPFVGDISDVNKLGLIMPVNVVAVTVEDEVAGPGVEELMLPL